MGKRLLPPAEKDLIRALRRQVAATSAAAPRNGANASQISRTLTLGIGDDCAILAPPAGHEILVTTDLSLETIHFRREWHTPESVGHRCLARGLSDLAAMGAIPLAAFLSLALPSELVRSRAGKPSWRDRFLAGLLALAGRYNVPLAGGDTSAAPAWPPLLNGKSPAAQTSFAIADIVLVGSAPRGQSLRRSGAKPGDSLYVTGSLGGAAAELQAMAASPRRFHAVRAEEPRDAHPQVFPEPRIPVGAWLRKHDCTAAIDVSDGLSTDLDHLCEESGCAATLEAAAIPIHPLAQVAGSDRALQLALQGGEDYELLFTSPADIRVPPRIGGVPVTRIGRMRRAGAGKPRILIAEAKSGKLTERPLKAAGWEHYRSDGRG